MYSPGFKNLNLDALQGAQALALRILTSLGCGQANGSHRCLLGVWQLYCCQGQSLEFTAKALGVSTGSIYSRVNAISARLGVPVEELRATEPGTPARALSAAFRARYKELEAAEAEALSPR